MDEPAQPVFDEYGYLTPPGPHKGSPGINDSPTVRRVRVAKACNYPGVTPYRAISLKSACCLQMRTHLVTTFRILFLCPT